MIARLNYITLFKKQAVRLGCGLLFLLLLGACASLAHEQAQLINKNLSGHTVLIDTPFFPQERYHCGPAALASIFHFHQRHLEPNDIAEQVFLPAKKGSLQAEMKAATRRAELFPYELEGGFSSLITELDAGNPVLVLQNLAFNWMPQWHYAVVLGYDPEKKQMILHSGKNAYYRVHISTFLSTWQRAGYWALVISPVEQMPATAQPDNYLREAIALETLGYPQLAFHAYQQALKRWPDNQVALFGAGNLYFQREQYQSAIEAFLQIINLEREHAAAWNNLAYALQAEGCYRLSQQAITNAIEYAHNKVPYLESQQELTHKHSTQPGKPFCKTLNLEHHAK